MEIYTQIVSIIEKKASEYEGRIFEFEKYLYDLSYLQEEYDEFNRTWIRSFHRNYLIGNNQKNVFYIEELILQVWVNLVLENEEKNTLCEIINELNLEKLTNFRSMINTISEYLDEDNTDIDYKLLCIFTKISSQIQCTIESFPDICLFLSSKKNLDFNSSIFKLLFNNLNINESSILQTVISSGDLNLITKYVKIANLNTELFNNKIFNNVFIEFFEKNDWNDMVSKYSKKYINFNGLQEISNKIQKNENFLKRVEYRDTLLLKTMLGIYFTKICFLEESIIHQMTKSRNILKLIKYLTNRTSFENKFLNIVTEGLILRKLKPTIYHYDDILFTNKINHINYCFNEGKTILNDYSFKNSIDFDITLVDVEWKLKNSGCDFRIPESFLQHISSFEQHYKKLTSSKKLTWLHHLSRCDLEVGNIKINCDLETALILTNFNPFKQTESIKFLIENNVIVVINNQIVLNQTSDTLEKNITPLKYQKNTNIEQNNILDKKHRDEAKLVNILKKHKKMDYLDLQKLLNIDDKEFSIIVQSLVDKEFIQKSTDHLKSKYLEYI